MVHIFTTRLISFKYFSTIPCNALIHTCTCTCMHSPRVLNSCFLLVLFNAYLSIITGILYRLVAASFNSHPVHVCHISLYPLYVFISSPSFSPLSFPLSLSLSFALSFPLSFPLSLLIHSVFSFLHSSSSIFKIQNDTHPQQCPLNKSYMCTLSSYQMG